MRTLMTRTLWLLMAALSWVPAWAWADSSTSSGQVSSATAPGVEHPVQLKDELWDFSPQVGVIGVNNLAGNYNLRAAYGLGINANLAPFLFGDGSYVYLGISTGGFYSHLGSDTSNLFGQNGSAFDPTATSAGLLVIPADLKLGYSFSSVRLSVHGGGNVTYRNFADSLDLGAASSASGGSSWTMFPNAGADLDVAIARGVNLTARPDFTFTTGNTLFMGTLGIAAMIY